jgi:hypothetical protein
MAVSLAECLCLIRRKCDRRDNSADNPLQAPEMSFMENDDVVEQIVPKTSDPPFGNSVLPRAAVAGADGRNTG